MHNQKTRLPTKQESAQIAENIYSQLKNTSPEELYPALASKQGEPAGSALEPSRRSRRAKEEAKKSQTNSIASQSLSLGTEPSFNQTPATSAANIKNMLSDEEVKKKPSQNSEMDLGMGDEGGDEMEVASLEEDSFGSDSSSSPEKIEDIGNLEFGEAKESAVQKCPSCKREAEKIIYCPKCGNAYCKSCAKSATPLGEYTCPKCGTKTKA